MPKPKLSTALFCALLCLLFAAPAAAGPWKDASKRHERDCKAWCGQNKDCGKCLPLLPCPPGTKKLKSWKGYGKNWHACSKPGYRTRQGKKHLQQCREYCRNTPNCGKCLPALPCPPGTKRLKTWKGYGKNWHACSRPGNRRRSEPQKAKCLKYCQGNAQCERCVTKLPCPNGTQVYATYKGAGRTYYACGRLGTVGTPNQNQTPESNRRPGTPSVGFQN